MESTVQTEQKGGKIRRGWELTKSSWTVLKLDKELAVLPVLSAITSLFVMVLFFGGLLAFYLQGTTKISDASFESANLPLWAQIGGLILFYFVMTLIANIFSGAIIHGAIERFKGGDPTVRGSLRATMRKFRPLALFSLLMATVGLALQLLEERVPLVGKIAVWLLNAAWSIANIFAVPVIVMSDKNVAPLTATKESVAIIRKVWGEGVVAQFGISVIASLTMFTYLAFWVAAGVGLWAISASVLAVVIVGVIAFIGMLALGVIFAALGGIMKAALYYYATTGEAPGKFNQELLRTAMTPKKARKIFA